MEYTGDVVIRNDSESLNFIGILLRNGYSVTIVPINHGKNFAIEILTESEKEEGINPWQE